MRDDIADQQIDEVQKHIDEKVLALESLRKSSVYILYLIDTNIDNSMVDIIYDDLRKKYSKKRPEKLDVILNSGGGHIDPAYNVALLFRRFANKELHIIVPRWAKSAATLLACAGDTVPMTPIAELGPVDPQITMYNPLEKRLEHFSPLDIGSTLELIREEFQQGHRELAQGLLNRLQFPLTLGGIKKSLQVGKNYIERLLSTRMHKDNQEVSKHIAQCLVENYATHGFCVDVNEAKRIGLKAQLLEDEELDIVWELNSFLKERDDIRSQKKQKEILEQIKNLPPEVVEKLISERGEKTGNGRCNENKSSDYDKEVLQNERE